MHKKIIIKYAISSLAIAILVGKSTGGLPIAAGLTDLQIMFDSGSSRVVPSVRHHPGTQNFLRMVSSDINPFSNLKVPDVLVTKKLAYFFLPVENTETTWRWNLPTSSDSEMEYGWLFSLRLDNKDYEIAFTKFKFPGSKPTEGGLWQLMEAGQADVWINRGNGSGETVREMGPVKARVVQDSDREKIAGILIVLENPKTVLKLREQRPPSSAPKTKGSILGEHEWTRVPIRYRE